MMQQFENENEVVTRRKHLHCMIANRATSRQITDAISVSVGACMAVHCSLIRCYFGGRASGRE